MVYWSFWGRTDGSEANIDDCEKNASDFEANQEELNNFFMKISRIVKGTILE